MLKINTTGNRLAWGIMLLLGIILTACSSATPDAGGGAARNSLPGAMPHAVSVNPPGGALMLSANTVAGDALGQELLPKVGSGSAILVTTMVDMENFDKSTAFGRTSMQQVGSRLSQHGFRVLEPRLGSSIRFEKREGEFILTRDSMKLLADNYNVHAVMVGTYSESLDKVYLSVRVVRFSDNAILGSYEYYLPKNGDVEALMGVARVPGGNHLWSRYSARESAFVPKK